MIGAWRNKRNLKNKPQLLVPFIIYHGNEVWKVEKMETYFGEIPGSFLRFLPSFDIIFEHISKMPDSVILACKTSFLIRTLLTLKHSHDKAYLREHFAELLFWDFNNEKDELSIFFFKAHFVYLSATSKISKDEIKKQITEIEINNNLKTRAMYAHEIIEKEAREEGKKEGLEEGLEIGLEKGLKKSVIALWQNDTEPYMVANFLNLEIEQVERFIAEFKNEKMGNKNGNE